MTKRVNVIGVGMTKFTKPGDPKGQDYHLMGADAAILALKDAGIEYKEVQQAWTGYVYGDSCSGMRALYEIGQTGIPIFNVNSNCSTGSSALFAARQAVASGAIDVALVLGFEKMEKGALQAKWGDRVPSLGLHLETQLRLQQFTAAPPAAQMFGGAGIEYQKKYGIADDIFGRIAVKARKHANANPYALFSDLLSLDEIMGSPTQYGPLTRYQCCPPTCGAGAAILCSDEFAKSKGINNPVYIAGQSLVTDQADSFQDSMMGMVGYGMAQRAASSVYEQAGLGAEDVDVVELHDCFTANELITYESLGLTPEGTAEKFIMDEENTYGGKVVVNPSGGLLSKGHPLGATGLAQCTELVWQLRGDAKKRQVEGAKVALQHNVGIGGACVVTMYRKD